MNDTQIDKYCISRDHVNAKRIHPVSSSVESLQKDVAVPASRYLWFTSNKF